MSDYHDNLLNNPYPEATPEEWDEWQQKQAIAEAVSAAVAAERNRERERAARICEAVQSKMMDRIQNSPLRDNREFQAVHTALVDVIYEIRKGGAE